MMYTKVIYVLTMVYKVTAFAAGIITMVLVLVKLVVQSRLRWVAA